MPRILIVDDEPEIVRGLEDNLRFEGYQTASATNGEDGLSLAASQAPDLVLLDIMMPKLSGWDVCRELRRRGVDVPIIMLTARGEEMDRVRGLELGADDYITKPFSIREFRSRVRALLRRAAAPRIGLVDELITANGLKIDLARRSVELEGRPVSLTYVEFELLRTLAAAPGRVFTRQMLLQALWGGSEYREPRTIDVHVRHLREKLERDPREPAFIFTVRGVGYRFRDGATR
jgi:DNA-binding response OmpR family regulator